MSRRLVAIATSTFLVGAAASMVWGDGGDATQIHACVAKDGTVRIVGANSSCKSQETPVHWSIIGPAGPAGPQGVPGVDGTDGSAGVDGEPGARGPSNGYVVNAAADPMYFDISTTPALVVATLNLDPGNYLVSAKLLVGNITGEANEDISCSLRQGASLSIWIDETAVRLNSGAQFAAGSTATLSLAGGVALSGGDSISLICSTSIPASTQVFPSGALAHLAKLTAVQVETLTAQ